MPDYLIFHIVRRYVNEIPRNNFLLVLLYLGCTTNQSIHFGCFFICWFRVIRALFLVFGVFVAEEVDGIGGKRSGYSTMVDVPTHL